MPKTEKPAPKKATKLSTKKVFDVAKPGKSAVSATSRPIIITNHPTAPDPMVVTTVAADAVPSAPLLPSASKVVIKPLDDTAQTEEAVHVITVSDEDKLPVKLDTTPIQKKPNAPSIEEVKQKAEAAAKPVVLAPTTVAPTPVAPTPPAPTAQPVVTKTDSDQDDAAVAKAAAERAEAVRKLVSAETYFLPINHREKRRTKRFVLLGLLLIVALAVAWLDVALDAGLISNPQNLPHSHFFTSKAKD